MFEKTKMTREEFNMIYQSNTNKEAAKILKIHPVTLLRYVRRLGLHKKGSGNRKPKAKIIVIQRPE